MVTTNKTDFFREPAHFDYLSRTVLPQFAAKTGGDPYRKFMIWSAGCSSGDEPYTLAMVLQDFAERSPGFSYFILATDISTRVLEKASKAIYEGEKIRPVPVDFQRKYLLRSKDRSKDLYRIVPELREKLRFRRLNFMDGDFGFREPLDAIFCRNVIIYFDRPTQERLLRKFAGCLAPHGYMFMGHSETLHGLEVPFVQVAPTIYRRSP
jgi:chemotaxis protein methyltransferase CheR